MSNNEIVVDSPQIEQVPIEVFTGNVPTGLCVDTELEITGYKREYAIVGDAYFPTVTAGETPAWMVDLINDIINLSLSSALTDVDLLKAAVLEALDELEVAKNQYQELINIEVTIDSIISSRLATLNANLDDANAQIIELWLTKVSADQAAVIAVQQISAELNSPTGQLYGAITNIQTTVTALNGNIESKYADLYDLNESTAFVLTTEINRVEASIEDVAAAVIESMDLALATDVLAVAQRVTDLTAELTQNGTYATVTDRMEALVTADEANASQLTGLQAAIIGTGFSSVEERMEAFVTADETNSNRIDTIGARYGVKLTAGGTAPGGGSAYVVGGFELLNNGSLVTAGWDVDEFWIGRVGVTGKRPFLLVGSTLYLDNAVIQDGAIVNAKIGDVIESYEYSPSNPDGWQIVKSGNARFNNIYARGDIEASSIKAGVVIVGATAQSSGFHPGNPTAGGWQIKADGSAIFNNVVISRPNVLLSGNIVLPAVGSFSAAHFFRANLPSGDIQWCSNGAGTLRNVYTLPDEFGTSYQLRHLEFTYDVPQSSYPNADVWTTNGPLLGVSCVITAADWYFTGSDPGGVYGRVACSGTIERVGNLTNSSFLRLRISVPLPDILVGTIRGVQIRNIYWSILAIT